MTTLSHDIENAGGSTTLARSLGVSIQRLVNWRSRGRVPADMVIKYCQARMWHITPHELRPDIYPNPTDGIPSGKLASLIASGVIKASSAQQYTHLLSGGCSYSAADQERRSGDRRQSDRRDHERRAGDRREAS